MASFSLLLLQSIVDVPNSVLLSNSLFLLSLILFVFAVYSARQKQLVKNLPPTPATSLPFIGHHHLLRPMPHIALHKLSQKYGPLIRLNLDFQFPTIVVSTPETAAIILKTHDAHFCSRPSLASISRFSYGGFDIAFSPYNHHWKQLRYFANVHLFNPSTVKSLSAVREQEVEALVKTLSAMSSTTVNISDIVMCFFNNIMFREVFGKRPTTGNDEEYGMKCMYHQLLMEVVALMAELSWGDVFPSLAWMDEVSGWKGRLEKSFRALDVVFEEGIAERMKRRGTHEEDACFLDVLLRHLSDEKVEEKNDSLGFQLSKVEVKAVLMNMFVGGTDTAASVLEWGMTRLMKNPEAMRKAQDEVRQIVGFKEKVKDSHLQELHYLKMVIKETLRLHPPAPLLLQRECLKDTTIEGYNIPAKSRVLINAWSLGRDPKYWENPEEFRPERFEGSHISYKGNHFGFIPFGAGRRICPGLALGIAGIELCMANLLCCFNWEVPEGMSREDICLDESPGIVSHRKEPLLLVPVSAVNV